MRTQEARVGEGEFRLDYRWNKAEPDVGLNGPQVEAINLYARVDGIGADCGQWVVLNMDCFEEVVDYIVDKILLIDYHE